MTQKNNHGAKAQQLPAKVRDQLSAAGKKGWQVRLAKARQAAKEKETAK